MWYAVATVPSLWMAVMGGVGDKLGLGVMLLLYALILVAVWLHRQEKASLGGTLVLPSGERLAVVPSLSGLGQKADGKRSARWEMVWDLSFRELGWWHRILLLFALLSAAYGIGLVIFVMVNPASKSLMGAAPYAFLNALLMMLVLTVGAPPPARAYRERPAGIEDPIVSAMSAFRRVEPARQGAWEPLLQPSPGEILLYQAGERLSYIPVRPTKNAPTAPRVAPGPLFLTLLLSAISAPLVAGMVVGALIVLKVVWSWWWFPLFAWSSGGLTLLFGLLSYGFLRRHARPVDKVQEAAQVVFDFAEAQLFFQDAGGVTPYHFRQCSALLLATDADEAYGAAQEEAGEEDGEGNVRQMPPLQVFLYGETLPPKGLPLATFASPDQEADGVAAGVRFAATLATSMKLPLFVTPDISL